MPNIFFNMPDVNEWVSEHQLQENYGVDFRESGWYALEHGDWALIIERHNKFRLWIWVRCDPRDDMERALDLNTFNKD